jgi:hypothetical protein
MPDSIPDWCCIIVRFAIIHWAFEQEFGIFSITENFAEAHKLYRTQNETVSVCLDKNG